MRKHEQNGQKVKFGRLLRTLGVGSGRQRAASPGIYCTTSAVKSDDQNSAPEWTPELEDRLRNILRDYDKYEGAVDYLIYSNKQIDVPSPPSTDLPIWQVAKRMDINDF